MSSTVDLPSIGAKRMNPYTVELMTTMYGHSTIDQQHDILDGRGDSLTPFWVEHSEAELLTLYEWVSVTIEGGAWKPSNPLLVRRLIVGKLPAGFEEAFDVVSYGNVGTHLQNPDEYVSCNRVLHQWLSELHTRPLVVDTDVNLYINVTHLELRDVPHATDEISKPFVNLEHLKLLHCIHLTDAVLEPLDRLTHLTVHGCPLVRCFRSFDCLTHLELHGHTRLWDSTDELACRIYSPKDYLALESIEHLTHLALIHGTPLSSKYLATLPSLTSLILVKNTPLTDDWLRHLSHITHLVIHACLETSRDLIERYNRPCRCTSKVFIERYNRPCRCTSKVFIERYSHR